MGKLFSVLMVGDVEGSPGRDILARLLPVLRQEFALDFVVVNGENAAGGFGITPGIADSFFHIGVDVITTGNHVWKNKEIFRIIETENRLLRPCNMPAGTPGHGAGLFMKNGVAVGVVNAIGRVYMDPQDCPFKMARERGTALAEKGASILLLDFHAEATSEKVAMGHHLDGLYSAVAGTHTHVQTADARVLPGGTGFITDLGMTGPHDSVIGVRKEKALRKFVTGMPARFEVAEEGVAFNGAVFRIDPETGRTDSVVPLFRSA